MTLEEVLNLHNEDVIYWQDPDGDQKYLKIIKSIEVKGDIVCIEDIDGSYLECFPHELS